MIRTIYPRRSGAGRKPQRPRDVDVADVTGPLDMLQGLQVTALFDVENFRGGAKDLGMKVSFSTLAKQLRDACALCRLHAVFSRMPGDEGQAEYLTKAGYNAHPRDIEFVETYSGTRKRANSDETILFLAGCLVTRGRVDAVLIGSGDGDLVTELSRNIAALPTKRKIFTLSLAGSTSHRLDARTNELIDGNIELGMNSMRLLTKE